jgi:hypothetical protein
LTLVLLWLTLPVAQGLAQAPNAPPAAPQAPAAAPDMDPLPGLPRPPDEPASLLMPATSPAPTSSPLPGRYFEQDPRLDPPSLPPGWFAGVETEIVNAHVKNKLINTVTADGRAPDIVALPSAVLDWTAAPRFEVGYRLPAGFGEFLVAYRFLATSGSQDIAGADGPGTLQSRLDLNMIDLDYASREFSLWPSCDLQWFLGLRVASVYFDSRAQEALAEAAAGSGIYEERVTDHYIGVGPHWGLELARRFDDYGLSLVGRIDSGLLLGRIRQGFFEFTTAGPAGPLSFGDTVIASSQAVPMLNAQAGLGWKPPTLPALQFFLGYEYEYWWNVGRLSVTTFSRGEMSDQGIALRAEFHF